MCVSVCVGHMQSIKAWDLECVSVLVGRTRGEVSSGDPSGNHKGTTTVVSFIKTLRGLPNRGSLLSYYK